MAGQENLSVAEKPQMKPIAFDKGIIPKDYDDVMRLAGLMHASGLAPKSLDTGQKIAIAMMMAMEVGMPIVTGIQNIAVINGKASIWGDAALAMVRKSGLLEEFEEWSKGERKTPGWIFYCKIKRKGQKAVTGSFSWEEAIDAGFDKIQSPSPWARWTSRMMQFKARNFVLRDQFGDVLRGMALAEDMQDAIDLEPEGNSTTYSMPLGEDEHVTVPESIEDIVAQFEAIEWPKGVNDFIKTLSDHFNKPEDEVKVDAMKDLDGFRKGFKGWREKQNPRPSDEKPEEPKTIRDEFIKLQTAGYSTWVFKNKDRLTEASEEILDEAEKKWKSFYSEPWPLDSAEAEYREDPFASEVNAYRGPLSDDTVDGVLLTFGEADNPEDVKEEFRQDVLKELKRLVDTK